MHFNNSDKQTATPPCPLCSNEQTRLLCRGKTRHYYQCDTCKLVFVPAKYHLSHEAEKAIYDQHENNPEDLGYRTFLNRLLEPLQEYIPSKAKGLDFGSGPGPTLSIMLEEKGHEMAIYDPYFANNKEALNESFDFITSTEVVEHLSKPNAVFEQLFCLLKDKGVIGIMTKLIPELEDFEQWHYTKDPTHITFYTEETFDYIARQYGYRAQIKRSDVIILLPEK